MRTGCFCNPAACQHYLQLTEDDIQSHYKVKYQPLINKIFSSSYLWHWYEATTIMKQSWKKKKKNLYQWNWLFYSYDYNILLSLIYSVQFELTSDLWLTLRLLMIDWSERNLELISRAINVVMKTTSYMVDLLVLYEFLLVTCRAKVTQTDSLKSSTDHSSCLLWLVLKWFAIIQELVVCWSFSGVNL